MQQLARLVLRSAQRNRCQIVCRHQLAHGLFRIFCKTHIAIGENACKLARGIGHRDAANAVGCHQFLRFAQSGLRRDGDRIDDHAAFKSFHRPHRCALFLNCQIAVEHTHPAQLRHDNRHIGFCNRIHRSRENRNVERDPLGQPRLRIGH